MILVFAAALQSSDFTTRRELTSDEKAPIERRVREWIARGGVRELEALAEKIVVARAEERPVYRIVVETQTESRTVVRALRPVSGKPPTRLVENVDPWAIERPPHDTWEDLTGTTPVEGTAEEVPCGLCGGDGKVPCPPCGGDGHCFCSPCAGTGRVNCSSCSGNGFTRCSFCSGSGSTGSSRRRSCSTCGGRGKRACITCMNGKKQCTSCDGRRETNCRECRASGVIPCKACAGIGRMVQSLLIRVTIASDRTLLSWSKLGNTWAVPEVAQGRVSSATEILAIPDSELRDAITSHVAAESTREHVLRQRTWLSRDAAILVSYEVAGLPYELVIAGERVLARRSPATEWAARRSESGRRALESSDFDRAREEATAALRVDPDSKDAAFILEAVDRHREELRRTEEETAALDRERAAFAEWETRRRSATGQMLVVGVAIGLGLLTAIVFVVWRAISRSRWSGGIVTRR
jgi:hypothetical protein